MTKKLEPLGGKEHVKAKRKPRAKKTETKRAVYKTPCISNGVRDVLLGTASGYTISVMYNYNPTAVAQAVDDYKRKMRNLANPPLELHAPRIARP